MNAFRWLFGIVTTLLLAGYIVLAVVGGNFRRSFGASPLSPLLGLLPCITMGMILASLLWPGRGLLHATAVVVIFGLLASTLILRESVTTGLLALGYLGCWLAYYWLSTRTPLAHG